jgi:hypothetical protein
MKGENTLQGGQDCCHIILFLRGPMFELQACHYYERFSQCYGIYSKPKPKEAKYLKDYINFFHLM